MIRLLREVGGAEDVGGAEAGADPGEQRARLLVLERPLQRVRVQRVLPVEPQLRQRRAQRRSAHPRRRQRLRRWEAVVAVVGGGGGTAVRGRQRAGVERVPCCWRCVNSKQRERRKWNLVGNWGFRKLEFGFGPLVPWCG